MRKILHQERKLWVILIAGLLLLLSSACKDSIKNDDLGPAISKSQFIQSMMDVVQSLNPETGIESRHWVFTYNYNYLMGRPWGQESASRIDVYNKYDATCYEEAQGVGLDYFEVIQKEVNGKPEQFYFDRKACFQKDKIDLLESFYYATYHGPGVVSSIHNLNISTIVEDAPASVVSRGCPGLDSCKIRVYQIEFYENILYPDGDRELRFHQRKISPDVPFIAHNLLYCITRSITLDGSVVSLKQCSEVRNFGKTEE